MWFLTKLWVPWWLYFGTLAIFTSNKTPLNEAGPLALVMFGWGGVNVFVTLIYIATRIFRRATTDGTPRP